MGTKDKERRVYSAEFKAEAVAPAGRSDGTADNTITATWRTGKSYRFYVWRLLRKGHLAYAADSGVLP
jgi:transposase-like protein